MSGNTAQCMAQANDAPIPKTSQLIFILMVKRMQGII